MNKADVVDRVAGEAGVPRQQAENVLNAFFDTVRSAARTGDRIGWPGFGSFSTTQRKARTGRNPRTGEAVKIPATKAVKFSASSTLKEFLNAGGAKKAGGTKKAAKKAGGAKKAAKKAPAKKAPVKKAPAKKAGGSKKAAKSGRSR
ncbi:MAG TPA: HU family DNA-binding protein [Acidimicrobiales bacterium]|nr:HU family DNA-binding protein [Acidimicrobiales bacterium]